MVDKHWDRIAPLGDPANNNVPLGYVEGFNNKIRALQRRAHDFHDEEYLRLKILNSGLRPI